MMANLLDDRDESEAFPVTNGVKQGCVIAAMHFSMVVSAMSSVTARMVYLSNIGLMAAVQPQAPLVCDEGKRDLSSETPCFLMSVHVTPTQSRRCSKRWTAS